MSTLMDPLDEPQILLLDLVWSQFEKAGEFPGFAWVRDQMRERGHDAAEVIGGLASIGESEACGRYSAVWTEGAGTNPLGRVCLTMAGLYHIKDQAKAASIISVALLFLRIVSERPAIADRSHDLPDVYVNLKEKLIEAITMEHIAELGAVVEPEWLAMKVSRTETNWSGRLTLLSRADFTAIEDYLAAVTAACLD